MRRILGFLVFFVLAAVYPSSAETIFCKNGRVARGKIQYHSRRSVWFDYNSDTTGVSFDEIDRIVNDDGSISKYDFRTLYKQSQQDIIEGQYGTDYTLGQHSELTEADLHITAYPLNSIDQEYNCFKNSVLNWKELQGTKTDWIMDAEDAQYDQGEEYMKAQIRLSYAEQMLPEY